jgi:hypothetical protein
MNEFVAIYERAEHGSSSAYTPNYPIAVSAPDRSQAKARILEAIQIYREEMESAGFAISEPSVEYETVRV